MNVGYVGYYQIAPSTRRQRGLRIQEQKNIRNIWKIKKGATPKSDPPEEGDESKISVTHTVCLDVPA